METLRITDLSINLDAETLAALAAFARCLQSEPDIAAAWIFGSRASGRARPDSDFDIAILLSGRQDVMARFERQSELEARLATLTGPLVQVVVLNAARPVLQNEVLSTGRLFFARDHEARIEFEVRTGKIHADLAPMRDLFQDALRRELREGGFGARR